MGQKIHPKGLRIGIIKDWDSKWYAGKKTYQDLLHEDVKIRKLIRQKLANASISRVEIERAANRVKLTIHTGKPGMVIGKGGAGVESLRKELERQTGKPVAVNIIEIKTPELDALLVAESVASQLIRRIGFRRAMKQAIQRSMRLGAKGVKIRVSGRLGGSEMARTEQAREGTVPLHTLRADIDYGLAEAKTTYGQIGVKVWIYKGEILPQGAGPVVEGRV
ncbi:MAG TPA: 30S ribosomal protein S3 [Bacillota bacterium]|jgi:small subunit ribosomal protein S3